MLVELEPMPSDSHPPSARCPDCDRAIVHGNEHEDRCEFVGYANDEVEAVRESWAQDQRYEAWAELQAERFLEEHRD